MRQRNDTGRVLHAHELGMTIGPGEEFDSPLHVPGCTRPDATEEPDDDEGSDDGSGEPPATDLIPFSHSGEAEGGHDEETSE